MFFFHIIFSIHVEKLLMRLDIEKRGMLPASDDDAIKLSNLIKKYKDLPVHPSYVKKITFVEDTSTTKKENVSNNLDSKIKQQQAQLDLLYEKYNSGFISQKELMEWQEKILKKDD